MNFVLGKASLQRLHTQSQAERAFQAILTAHPENSAALAGLAEVALLDVRNVDRAAELANKALMADPGSHSARSALGWSHFLRCGSSGGDEGVLLATAEEMQRDAIANEDGGATVALYQLRLGRSLWCQGGLKRRESLKVFIKTCKLDPGCSLAFTYLGHHYAVKKATLERATRCYEKAILLEPLESEAGETLFKIYANAGKVDEVVKLCQRVTDAAFGPFMRVVKWAWLGLGRALLSQNKVGPAVDACQAAARAAPDDPHAWQVLGDAYQARGSYIAAINAYGKVIELDDTTIAARFQMATVNGILGNVNEAIDQFEQVVALQSKYLPAHVGLADVWITNAAAQLAEGVHGSAVVGVQEALSALGAAIAINDGYSCVWKLVGDVCSMARALPPRLTAKLKVPPSIMAASDSASADGGGGSVAYSGNVLSVASSAYRKRVLLRHTAEGWVDLATSLHFRAIAAQSSNGSSSSLEDVDVATLAADAVNAAKQAVRLAPKSYVCWTTLGVASTGAKNPALAQHAFIKSIELEANNPNAWVNLGVLYLQSERIDLANKAFSTAQSLDPSMSRAWVGQAMIAEKMGSKEALDLFRHALELHNHPSACIGFAFHVVASTSHEYDADADSIYMKRETRLQRKRDSLNRGAGGPGAVVLVHQSGVDGQGGEGSAAAGADGAAGEGEVVEGAPAEIDADGSDNRGIPLGYESQYIVQAAAALSQFTQSNPGAKDACAWNLLGLLQEKQDLNPAAAAAFEECGALLTGGNAAATGTVADHTDGTSEAKVCSLNLARAKLNCGKSSEAMKLYQIVGVEHFVQVCALGRAAYKSGELHLAYQYYEKALTLAQAAGHKARAADTYVALATIAFANSDTDLSKQLLFQAVADPCLCPRALFVMCALGLLNDDAVLATSALAEFPKLQALGLASADSFLRDQNVLTSSLLQLQGHIKFARNALLKAVHMYPNSSSAWREMAMFLNRFTTTMPLAEVTPCAPAAGTDPGSKSSGFRGDSDSATGPTVESGAGSGGGTSGGIKVSRTIISSAAHCATGAWAVKGQDADGILGSGSALGLAAVGHLVAGTEAAVHEACRSAIKAAHETPQSPDAWSAVSAAAFVRGARFSEAKWIKIAIAACNRCIVQVAAEHTESPASIHNASRTAMLQLLEYWAHACLCECYLVLAYCTNTGDVSDGDDAAAAPVKANITTMISRCNDAIATYTSQGASADKLAPFYLLVARGKLGLGAAKEAFATAVQALKLVPTSADGWQVAASILEHTGLVAEAEACFRQSLSALQLVAKQRVAILLRLSLSALRFGNTALGLEASIEAVRLGPTMEAVRLLLGISKLASNDVKGGKKELKKAGKYSQYAGKEEE